MARYFTKYFTSYFNIGVDVSLSNPILGGGSGGGKRLKLKETPDLDPLRRIAFMPAMERRHALEEFAKQPKRPALPVPAPVEVDVDEERPALVAPVSHPEIVLPPPAFAFEQGWIAPEAPVIFDPEDDDEHALMLALN